MLIDWPLPVTPKHAEGVRGPFSAVWDLPDIFDNYSNLLDEHSIIAGGAVRDAIMGVEPRDIDVFVSGAGMKAAAARVQAQAEDDWVAAADIVDVAVAGAGSASPSGLRSVVTFGDIQVIEVDDPWRRVRVFDAICNMVWVDVTGTAWAASELVLTHIANRVWVPNPNSVMTPHEFNARRKKFYQRGWYVPDGDGGLAVKGWVPGLPDPSEVARKCRLRP